MPGYSAIRPIGIAALHRQYGGHNGSLSQDRDQGELFCSISVIASRHLIVVELERRIALLARVALPPMASMPFWNIINEQFHTHHSRAPGRLKRRENHRPSQFVGRMVHRWFRVRTAEFVAK
jgi:hypothetical protein